MTSKSEMKRKNALAGKPLDDGLSSRIATVDPRCPPECPTCETAREANTASVLCPICLVGAKDTSEGECASCRAPLTPGKSEIPREAGKAAEEFVSSKVHPSFDSRTGYILYGFKAGYDARDAYLLKLHGEGAMAEVIQLQAEVKRLEEELMLADVGAVYYQSERDAHIKEQETFNHEAVKKIQEMGIENKRLLDWIASLSAAWLPSDFRDERRVILAATSQPVKGNDE